MAAGMKAQTEYLTFQYARAHKTVQMTPQGDQIVRTNGIDDGLPTLPVTTGRLDPGTWRKPSWQVVQ